ncbi:MAG: ECF-type sigma factor [Holophagales bacterium]|nr:ECF-type sigma factor [Holophagales bacterium]
MTDPAPGDITALLAAWQRGDPEAADRLAPLIYPELRQIAAGLMRIERGDHTLQPTALIHETYLRLVQQERIRWQDRHQFFAVAARLCQRILVDHARRRLSHKRGGDRQRLELSEVADLARQRPDLLLELDLALEQLEALEPRQAAIVRARFFGGLTETEVARALGLSRATVKRDWRLARAWLFRELRGSDTGDGDGG